MTISSKLYAGAKTTQLLFPAVYSTDQLSSSFDLQDFSDCQFIVDVGAATDTWSSTDKIELELQDSPDDSSYTACADAVISNPVSGATNTGTFAKLTTNATQEKKTYIVAYRGNQRYVKVNVNFSGTHSTGSIIGVIGQGWVGRAQPVNAG